MIHPKQNKKENKNPAVVASCNFDCTNSTFDQKITIGKRKVP